MVKEPGQTEKKRGCRTEPCGTPFVTSQCDKA